MKNDLRRRRVWLPASTYYMIVIAVGLAIFFLVWGILHDGGEEMPWIPAGLVFSFFLIGATVLREIFLRRSRERHRREDAVLERQMRGVRAVSADNFRPPKLTLEDNSRVLDEIRRKSEAARVLGKFSAAHREVFEMCGEYLTMTERELSKVAIGSPRLPAITKGRRLAARLHHEHLLQWAQIEAREKAGGSEGVVSSVDKIESIQSALSVIDSALEHYPDERSLIESHELLREMLASTRVAKAVEEAERQAFKGNYREAVSSYRDALFYLGRDNIDTAERRAAAEKIRIEIERLSKSQSGIDNERPHR
ncbi:MAG: hypothetical protein HS105_05130 [Chloracidobacterium sp.]|nr:hypothetical protein [Chloracidobacterium sp.]MCC6826437.1 hypothetical protein [Acidobacteriota bacterium]MCO5334066.1 hypothetical protein [Pyrinomonadaceae bacterium]